MSGDLCPCGCGEPRHYPVGLTLAEAKLVGRVLSMWGLRGLPGAQSVVAKVDRATKP